MTRYFVVAFLTFWLTSSVASIDLSYVGGTTGTAVVIRCVELIDNSGIFTYDEEMVRRIAYVETRDGENYTSGTGGIWKIKGTILTDIENATSYFTMIESVFNITWSNVVYDDLDAPIYSALAFRIRLALHEEEQNTPVPSDIDTQYQIWQIVFQGEDPSLTNQEFTDLIAQLPAVLLCPSVYRDIVILIDSSQNIANSDFELTKSFLLSIVDHFNVGTTFTRIGIVQFSALPDTTLMLSQGVSSAAVSSAINGLEKQSSSLVEVGLGINLAVSQFTTDQGGRGPETGVARVVLLLSHMLGSSNITSSVSNAAAESVQIVAVGVTSSITTTELMSVTSTVFYESSYATLSNVADNVQTSVCQEQVSVPADQLIMGSLEAGESMTFSIAIPSSGINVTVSVSIGSVSLFYSQTIVNPTSVFYDFNMNATVASPTTIEFTPAGGSSFVYFTIEDSSSTAARTTVTSMFECRIGDPIVTTTTATTTTIATVVVVGSAQSSGLSDGEIAGIVMACLIFIAGLLIAIVYYYFCRIAPSDKARLVKESVLEFRNISRNSTTLPSVPVTPVPANIPTTIFQARSEIPDRIPPPDKPLNPPQFTPPSVYSSTESVSVHVTNSNVSKPLNPPQFTSPSVYSSTESVSVHVTNSNVSVRQHVQTNDENGVRKRLRVAVESKDLDSLQSAVQSFQSLHLVDIDGDLIKGERLLSMKDCKQGLSNAISQRDVKLLERSIYTARQKNFEPELQMELKKAEVLLKDLKKVEAMLMQISCALLENKTSLVESLVFEMRAMTGFDQSTVNKMIDVHRSREEIRIAIMNRDNLLATDLISQIIEKGYEKDLHDDIKQAKKMIKELEYLEKVRNDVLNLSQSKVSEIRSYSNPPPGVRKVMTAVYQLLGHPQYETEHWSDIQALMGRTGKDSLKRKILNVDPRKVQLHDALEAKKLVAPFSVESIQEISIGLALFYIFAVSVIEEVEKLSSGIQSAPSPFLYNLEMNVYS